MNIDLTHPEILTTEQLQKFVGSDITNDRDELIQLFYKYVAPLPQRKFRPNRLGLLLTESQKQFRGEKRTFHSDSDETEKALKSKLRVSADGLEGHIPSEKHESDRGIYTITRTSKNTAPIKLKRPTSTADTNSDQDANKRIKSDTPNT